MHTQPPQTLVRADVESYRAADRRLVRGVRWECDRCFLAKEGRESRKSLQIAHLPLQSSGAVKRRQALKLPSAISSVVGRHNVGSDVTQEPFDI